MLGIHIKSFKHLAGLSYAGLAGSSAAFLLIMAAMLFAPAASQPEAAAEKSANPNPSISTYASDPSASINLPSTIDFADVLPTAAGVTTTASASLTITTSNSGGYSLYFYSSNGNNSLTPINPNNSSSISSTPTTTELNNLNNNTWGYNLSAEASTSNTTTYSAIPTNNTTPIQTKDTSTTNSTNDTYTLSLGAKVDNTIPSGVYSNDLTVAIVAEPKALTYIQDLTLSECQSQASDTDLTVKDSRDDNEYTVRYINDACWMTQNLRLPGGTTLTTSDSNVTRNYTLPNSSTSGFTSYTVANMYNGTDTTYGAYYNYCAASAGTVCSSYSAQDATQDICPKGWRLPTYNEQNGIRSYVSAFSPVYSGDYSNGSLGSTGSLGYWWSATAYNSLRQYGLYYSSGSLDTTNLNKYVGFSVRCVRSTPGTLTINFDGNGSTGGSTTSQQIAAGNTASLNANGFTRTNYVFAGWNTAADGSGTSYADGADYTVTPATGDATATLYAQWGPSIQNFTNAQCRSLASNGNYTVYDTRDGSDYTVRYINGACWMTQNLRLSGGRTLTSADSNVASSWSFPSTSLTSGDTYTKARSLISRNISYGGYYNYCAASAGTVCDNTTEQDASQDICPKGWKLPTKTQFDAIAGNSSYSSTFSPVYSGGYHNGSLSVTGSAGYWWSATASSSTLQYYMYYSSGRIGTVGNSKRLGYSVRCVRSS